MSREVQRGAAALLALFLSLAAAGCTPKRPPLPTVERVDLQRFAGSWFEIARLPNFLQRGCVLATARFELLPSGRVSVENVCTTASGRLKTAHGLGEVVDPDSNARLLIRFDKVYAIFLPAPAKGNFWIVDLDPGYGTALVATPSRSHLWVYSRRPRIDPERYEALLQRARSLGFDTSRLVRADWSAALRDDPGS